MNPGFISKIKEETDLIQLVNEYSAEPLQKISPNLWRGHCPHPMHNDSDPSFDVHINTDGSQTWCCNGCHIGSKDKGVKPYRNYGSDAIAFIQFMHDKERTGRSLTFAEAVAVLAKRLGIPMPDQNDYFSRRAAQLKDSFRAFEHNLTAADRTYLYSRGLSDEDICKWHIGSFLFRRFGYRIVFPVQDHWGNFKGYSARTLGDGPKYINSRNDDKGFFAKRKEFYGAQFLDMQYGEIFITEGVMDVIMASKYGLKNVVATLGTSLSADHVQLIKKWNLRPTLIYDNDVNAFQTGQRKTKTALELFEQAGIYAYVCPMPAGKDIAELLLGNPCNMEEYVHEHRLSFVDYLLNPLAEQYKAQRAELQRKMLPAIMRARASIHNEEEKFLLEARIKEEFNL